MIAKTQTQQSPLSMQSAIDKVVIEIVYSLLKDRHLHPKGEFDKAGRFYLSDGDLVNVREPSRAYPYSQMSAGRTKKFIKKLIEHYAIANLDELLKHFSYNLNSDELLDLVNTYHEKLQIC